MRRITGRFIIKDSNEATPDRLDSFCKSEDISDQIENSANVFDVCISDENSQDLLLINSRTGRCMLIKNALSFMPAGKGFYNDYKTRL